jgi:hypothetical protein
VTCSYAPRITIYSCRNNVIAMVEIARSAEGQRILYGDTDVVDAVRALEHLLSGLQAAGQFPA